MKILVISFAGIGDSLLATPLIRGLRGQFPDAEIDALVRWRGAQELLQQNPDLRTIHFEATPWGKMALFWRLRRRHYDISINVHPQSKVEYRLLARLINAHQRLSHRYDNYGWLDRLLINASLEQSYAVHCVENNLNLLKLLRLEWPANPSAPEIVLSDLDEKWAEGLSRQKKLGTRKVLGVHVGSGKTKNLVFKRWPVGHYIQLVRKVLCANPNVSILLFGGPDEKEANSALLAAVGDPRLITVPSRTIQEAAAMLKRCTAFVSVDNLFMHLAAAVKVPHQIVIESPTFNKTVEPYRRPFRLVKNPVVAGRNLEYYRYNGRNIQGPPEHLLACMQSISPEAVLAEVLEVLRDPG